MTISTILLFIQAHWLELFIAAYFSAGFVRILLKPEPGTPADRHLEKIEAVLFDAAKLLGSFGYKVPQPPDRGAKQPPEQTEQFTSPVAQSTIEPAVQPPKSLP